MNRSSLFLFLLLVAITAAGCRRTPPALAAATFGTVEVREGWLQVDGEKFLIVGIGYEPGCRPGQLPWARSLETDLLRADFQRIREAGFNTLRTWAPLSDEELTLAAGFGLWVIQGLWIDPHGNFADPKFQAEAGAYLAREVTRLARHPNILYYLVLNEPSGETVLSAGVPVVENFYRDLAGLVRQCDPARPVSYANCVFTDFVEPAMFDVASYNVYPYSPATIEKALGYRGYLDLLKARVAADKPLVVTEFGLSVSPAGDGRGYGGNSLEQQRDGVVRLWDDILNAGAAGGCAFMWVDGWWKAGDEHTHDDHAEEWYGLLEADREYTGIPRPVYFALQDYNHCIRTQPHDGDAVGHEVLLELYAPDVHGVQYRLNQETWREVFRSNGRWWRTTVSLAGRPTGPATLWTRAFTSDGTYCSAKACEIYVGDHAPPTVALIPPSDPVYADQPLTLRVRVARSDGRPLADIPVRVERFAVRHWHESGAEAQTDHAGEATVVLPPLGFASVVALAAGIEYGEGRRRRGGDYVHLEILPGRPR